MEIQKHKNKFTMPKKYLYAVLLTLAAAAASAKPFMSLRHGSPTDREMMDIILQCSDKSGTPWDEMWFYINPFLKTADVVEKCKMINAYRDECQKRGIDFSFQVIALGHPSGGGAAGSAISGMLSDAEYGETLASTGEINFEKGDLIIDENGNCQYRLCPNSERARQFNRERTKLFVEQLRPKSYWVDDDLRFSGGDSELFACFCETCLKKFSEFAGQKYTREEIVGRISKSVGTWEPLREKWVEFCGKSLGEFCREAYRKPVDELMPECFLGFQNIHSRYKHNGLTSGGILKGLAGSKSVGIRPGAGYYEEGNPRLLVSKIFDVAREAEDCRKMKFVSRITYEAENYPRISILKSPEAMMAECALALAAGCDSLSLYWYFGKNFDSIESYEQFAQTCAEWKPYLKKVAKASKNTRLGGIARPLGAHAAASPKLSPDDVFPADWWTEDSMYNMMLTGFPVCPENAKPDIVFLTGRAVETFDDSELEALLKKNLIINHDALAPLAKRGINLGVRALPKAGGTEFVDGRTYWFFGGVPLEVDSAYAEILAGFQSGGKMRAGLCVVKTPQGASALVVGGYGFARNPTHFKRKAMLDGIDKIAPLSVRLDTTWRAAVYPRVDKKGRVCAATIMNLSEGKSLPLKLRIRNPKSRTPKWETPRGAFEPECEYNADSRELKITVPPLEAWKAGTLIF